MRRKKEEGRRKKEEGRRKKLCSWARFPIPDSRFPMLLGPMPHAHIIESGELR
ncbi:hypothetical protein [Microcoleus vaginatus]|uniref:hypothetical protein n=1 Tax=Microcoleus vaginatus TaxID=119532 RepID=UPI0002F40AD4